MFGVMLADPTGVDDAALRRALMVHRNTSRAAARDALIANYPVVAALVGDDAFAACAGAYVESAPPAEPMLCQYGAAFPGFAASWQPFAELGYLRAVATVERLVVEALFAADAPVLDTATLDLAAPLVLHPATRIARLDAPGVSLWHAHQIDAAPDAIDEIVWADEVALVTRPYGQVEMRAIDDATLAFLSATTLGAAAQAAADRGGDIADIYAALLMAGAFASADDKDFDQ